MWQKYLCLMRVLVCGYRIESEATNYAENKPHVLSFYKNSTASGIFGPRGIVYTRKIP